MLKKVLILSYFFPPSNFAGSYRVFSWAKYLNRFGYYPVIITRNWKENSSNYLDISKTIQTDIIHKIFETHEVYYLPYKGNLRDYLLTKYGDKKFVWFRKILSFTELLLQNVSTRIIPFNNIYTFAKNYISENKDISLLIASGKPFILFKFGYLLNQEFKIPWIADYRDEWTTHQSHKDSTLIQKILNQIESKFERKWIRNVFAITTVSEHWAKRISTFNNSKCYVVMNGYDDFPDKLKDIDTFSSFTITHNGSLYDSQPHQYFIDAFINIIEKYRAQIKIELLFPGLLIDPKKSNEIRKALTGYEEFYSILPRITHEEVILMQKKCHVLLMIGHTAVQGWHTSKVFEYLACNKPILLCPSDNDVIEQLIKETNTGKICNTTEECLVTLSNYIEEYILTGKIAFNPKSDIIVKYHRKGQAEKLASLFNQALRIKKFKIASILSDIYYQQCNRCVMDTNDPDIFFDENGNCNHCNNYLNNISKRIYQGEKTKLELNSLVATIKKSEQHKKYDCLLGISGGVDSCYAAYILKQLGLRVLAVHMDNGWNSDISVKNIKHIVNQLGFDYQSYVLDWEEFKDLQLSFLRASVPEAETPTDVAIQAALHKIAAKYNIKYIISGGNYATEGILPKRWHYNAKDLKYLKSIHKQFGTKPLRTFPTFEFQKEIYYKFIKKIKIIYLLNYIPYSKSDAMHILEKELNWQYYGGKHYESKYTGFIQSYLLPEKFGIDYRKATFSTQICTGEMTRDQAIQDLQTRSYNTQIIENEKEYICTKLDISKEELDTIIKMSPKSYLDFPNNDTLLEYIYAVYRKLRK